MTPVVKRLYFLPDWSLESRRYGASKQHKPRNNGVSCFEQLPLNMRLVGCPGAIAVESVDQCAAELSSASNHMD